MEDAEEARGFGAFLLAVGHNRPASAFWVSCSVGVMNLENEYCVSF
jgi:hypothetical protein